MKMAFGSCYRGFRNAKVPVWVRVSYYDQKLKIDVDADSSGKDYLECFSQQGIKLPTGYFFGVSASTGSYPGIIYQLMFR